jgi:hypothetical protein
MEEIKCTVTLKFNKIKFIPTFDNNGRCLKCDAREFCGIKFNCPCNINEQLILICSQIH